MFVKNSFSCIITCNNCFKLGQFVKKNKISYSLFNICKKQKIIIKRIVLYIQSFKTKKNKKQ